MCSLSDCSGAGVSLDSTSFQLGEESCIFFQAHLPVVSPRKDFPMKRMLCDN